MAADQAIAAGAGSVWEIDFPPGVAWLSAAAGPTAVSSVTARTLAAPPTSSVASSGSAGIAVVGDEIWTTYSDL